MVESMTPNDIWMMLEDEDSAGDDFSSGSDEVYAPSEGGSDSECESDEADVLEEIPDDVNENENTLNSNT